MLKYAPLRRFVLRTMVCAGMLICGPLVGLGQALAQATFPSGPVTIIVGFPPGGAVDLIARTLAPAMSEQLGQPVVVENMPGANGAVGATSAAGAEPDGHTLLFSNQGLFVISPHIMKEGLAYDPLGFAPISLIARSAFVLVANPQLPASTLPELIALAKEKPGALNYASSGVGGVPHLAFELLKQKAGIDVHHIGYAGTNPANVALLSGEVDLAIGAIPALAPFIASGQMKALGVTSAARYGALPDIAPMADAVSGYDITSWFVYVAPAGTPTDRIEILNRSILAALKDPQVVKQFESDGTQIVGSTPDELMKTMQDDYVVYQKLIETLDLAE